MVPATHKKLKRENASFGLDRKTKWWMGGLAALCNSVSTLPARRVLAVRKGRCEGLSVFEGKTLVQALEVTIVLVQD